MKKLFLVLLSSLFLVSQQTAIALATSTQASEKYEYAQLKKQLAALEEQIILEKNTLKHTIVERFPLEKQKISFFAGEPKKELAPIFILRNAPKKLTVADVEQKMRATIDFIKTHIRTTPRKETTLELLDICEQTNMFRQEVEKKPATDFSDIHTQMKKDMGFVARKSNLLNELKDYFVTLTPKDASPETKSFLAKTETPHSILTSLLLNFHLLFEVLYENLDQRYEKEIFQHFSQINPKFAAEYKKLNTPFKKELTKRAPYFSATIHPNEETKTIYLQIWEFLINKMNFNLAQPSIFNAFNTKDNLDENKYAEYKKSKYELEDLQVELARCLDKINAYARIPFPITDSLETLFYCAIKSVEQHPDKLKKTASDIEKTLKNTGWRDTAIKITKHKNQLGIRMLEVLNSFAKKYVAFVKNADNMQVAKDEFNTIQKKEIAILCELLLKKTKITLHKAGKIEEKLGVNANQLTFLLITDICQEIENTLLPEFSNIKKLYQQRKDLLTQINHFKETIQKNDPAMLWEEDDQENKPHKANKFEENEQEVITSPTDKITATPILSFTKKLKQSRAQARNIPVIAGNTFQNELSDAEAMLFHNLPITGLLEHPEIAKIRNKFLQNQPLPKANTICFQKKEDTLFIWIPAIFCYQVNGIKQIQKGAIEIFCEKQNQDASTPELKLFHIWFKNMRVIKTSPSIAKHIIKQINNQLSSIKATNAEKLLEKIDVQKIIPNKEGWHVEIASNNQILLVNTNEKPTQNNWIFYQS